MKRVIFITAVTLMVSCNNKNVCRCYIEPWGFPMSSEAIDLDESMSRNQKKAACREFEEDMIDLYSEAGNFGIRYCKLEK
jgi:hypothetical protein